MFSDSFFDESVDELGGAIPFSSRESSQEPTTIGSSISDSFHSVGEREAPPLASYETCSSAGDAHSLFIGVGMVERNPPAKVSFGM